jgi:hypothetical protein
MTSSKAPVTYSLTTSFDLPPTISHIHAKFAQHNTLLPLHLISHFDLAQLVPLNGQISFHALASSIGINQSALTSILRLGIACRIFSEPQPGFIAHSAASRQIAEDVRVASWVGSNVDDMAPAAARVVDALVKWPEAGEPNQTVSWIHAKGMWD